MMDSYTAEMYPLVKCTSSGEQKKVLRNSKHSKKLAVFGPLTICCEKFAFKNEQISLVSSIFNHLFGMQMLPMLGKLHHGRYLISGRGASHAEIMNFLSACIRQNGADK